MNADHILAGIDCAIFDPSLVVSLRKLLVGLAVSGNLRTTAVGTVASSPFEMPSSDSLPIEPSELPAAGMTVEQFVRLGSIAELKKGETGIQKATPGRFPLVVTAQQRATTDHYDFDGPSAIVPLVSSTGHGKASLHRLHYQDGQYAVGNILAAIFPRSGSGITARFLYEYLSAFKDELLVTRMTGTANVALTIGRLKDVPVPIVSPRCQEVVDELMALCDRLEAAQAEREARRDCLVLASLARVTEPDGADTTSTTTSARFHLDHFARLTTRPEHVKELRQTILNLAVRGRLVPRDEIWQRKPLSELCPLITSGSRGWAAFYAKSGAAFVRAQNIRFGLLRLDDLAHVAPPVTAETQRCRLQNGDLLIVITGAGVTTPACVDRDLGEAYVSQHVALTRPADASFSPWLLLCLLATQGCRGQLLERAYGAGKPGLNLDNIRTLEVPLPPLAEQRRIVAKVDELMALCDQLEASLASAAADRARLLEALLHEALAPAA